jgi:hypothetical protein
VSLQTRVAVLEAALHERELDLCSRFLADRYRVPVAEVRQEIQELLARRQAEGRVLSPAEIKQAKELRQEMEQWESSRDRPQQAAF